MGTIDKIVTQIVWLDEYLWDTYDECKIVKIRVTPIHIMHPAHEQFEVCYVCSMNLVLNSVGLWRNLQGFNWISKNCSLCRCLPRVDNQLVYKTKYENTMGYLIDLGFQLYDHNDTKFQCKPLGHIWIWGNIAILLSKTGYAFVSKSPYQCCKIYNITVII